MALGHSDGACRRRHDAQCQFFGTLSVRDGLGREQRGHQPVPARAGFSAIGARNAANEARRMSRSTATPIPGFVSIRRRSIRDKATGKSWAGRAWALPAWAAIIAIVDQGRVLEGKGSLDGATPDVTDALFAAIDRFQRRPASGPGQPGCRQHREYNHRARHAERSSRSWPTWSRVTSRPHSRRARHARPHEYALVLPKRRCMRWLPSRTPRLSRRGVSLRGSGADRRSARLSSQHDHPDPPSQQRHSP